MTRPYYYEYAAHAMRFYARTKKRKYMTKADFRNWIACAKVLSFYSKSARDLLMEVYQEKSGFMESVDTVAKTHQIHPNTIWKLNDDFLTKFAKIRGLI